MGLEKCDYFRADTGLRDVIEPWPVIETIRVAWHRVFRGIRSGAEESKFRSLGQTLNRAGTKFLSFFHKPGLIVKRRPSHSIDPNPIGVIDENARVALAAHKEINNSGRYTHI